MTIQKQIEAAQLALRKLGLLGLDYGQVIENLHKYMTNLSLSAYGANAYHWEKTLQPFHAAKDLNNALDRAYELGQAELERKQYWQDLWKSLAPLLKDVLFKAIVKGA